MATDNDSMIVALPVFDTELPDDLHQRFEALFEKIYDFKHRRVHDEASYEKLRRRIKREVATHPVLASTVARNFLRWSLLTVLCEKTHCHSAMKYLIEQNPSSLLWDGAGDPHEPRLPIYIIAHDHCEIMPWIAEHHAWVFGQPECLKRPPHLTMIRQYTDGECSAMVVRQFYDFYPQGLSQENQILEDGLPIHRCLVGWEECDADLLKWMALKAPDSMSHEDRMGYTPLFNACSNLSAEFSTEKMTEICRFLASKCPASVRVVGRWGTLPMHTLLKRVNRPAVQDVLLQLLRIYPESANVVSELEYVPHPLSVPLVRDAAPLIQDELDFQEEIVLLKKNLTAFCEAMSVSKDRLNESVSGVFKTWAVSSIDHAQESLASIKGLIDNICRENEGEDVASDEEEDADEDGVDAIAMLLNHNMLDDSDEEDEDDDDPDDSDSHEDVYDSDEDDY